MITLFLHPFGSTSKGTTFNNNLSPILGHLIALPINVYLCSITTANDVLYLVGPSFVLNILDTMYYTLLEYETMLFNSTTIDSFMIHFFFHLVKLLDLIIFVNLGSPCNSCSSPFYYSSWKQNCYKFKYLTIVSNVDSIVMPLIPPNTSAFLFSIFFNLSSFIFLT